MGIETEDEILFTLLFADDQIVVAADEEDLSYMVRKLEEEYATWGLKINYGKTEYLVIGGLQEDLQLEGESIRCVEQCKYLGSIFTKEGNCEADIRHRVTQGKKAIRCLNSFFWSPKIQKDTKKRVYNAVVKPITLYGSESWTLSREKQDKLRALEMDCFRRACCVSRLERIRNEEIRRRIGSETSIVDDIEAKQLVWYGHVQRMENDRWPKRMLKYCPPSRRRRGRPRRTWIQGIQSAMEKRQLTEEDWWDRERWRLGCEKRTNP